MKQLLEFLRQKLKGKRCRLVVFLGIAGLVLILLSGFLPDKSETVLRTKPAGQKPPLPTSPWSNCRQTEQQLVSILEQGREGVGTCQVMLTADGTSKRSARTGSGTGARRIPHQDPEEMRDRFRQQRPASGTTGSCTGDQRRDRGVRGGVSAVVQERVTKAVQAVFASRRQPHLCGSGGIGNTE